jgi:hypothetical protein
MRAVHAGVDGCGARGRVARTMQLRAEHRGAEDVTCVVAFLRRGGGTLSRRSLTDPVTGSENPATGSAGVQAARGVLRAEPHVPRDEHAP